MHTATYISTLAIIPFTGLVTWMYFYILLLLLFQYLTAAWIRNVGSPEVFRESKNLIRENWPNIFLHITNMEEQGLRKHYFISYHTITYINIHFTKFCYVLYVYCSASSKHNLKHYFFPFACFSFLFFFLLNFNPIQSLLITSVEITKWVPIFIHPVVTLQCSSGLQWDTWAWHRRDLPCLVPDIAPAEGLPFLSHAFLVPLFIFIQVCLRS